ncbi:MAG: NAD(P)-binding protein [Armatimonadota bacterium]|nr:NAD(P)-binding protein [Armatimonadota bacterium]MDR5702098.1 NAD(P)-binding protein [Armatimonadota bacterium]
MGSDSMQDLPDAPLSWGDTRWNKTGNWRHMRPEVRERAAPCAKACPLGNPIPKVMTAVSRGDLEEAARLLLERNPFPAITGRVCPHPCEVGCNRRRYDEPLAIRSIERLVGDWIQEHRTVYFPSETGKRVAIVGSGPAGLAAASYLRRQGHRVVVYDRNDRVGGMLVDAIPSYRLPRSVVEREARALEQMGVVFQLGVTIGRDVSVEQLLSSYDAVLVATGAHGERRMGIPGEEHFLGGLEFLRAVRRGERKPPGRRVAVVGGGNVAIDVARTLVRLGASPVILYRRTRKEMPAIEEEVERAEADGVEFQFLTLPTSAVKLDGYLRLVVVRIQLGERDRTGRPRPVPIPGSEFELECDAAIRAIGEVAETEFLPREVLDDQGWVVADKFTGATKRAGLFVAGDLVTGPATVVEAIAAGLRAGRAIDRFVRGEALPVQEKPLPTVPLKEINLDYFPRASRVSIPELPLAARCKTFDEEILGLDLNSARGEAARCFSCGSCNLCANCWIFCPDAAIHLDGDLPWVNLEYCKGCGVCATECPRGVITMKEELAREGAVA